MAELRFGGRDNPALPIWLNPNIFLQNSPNDPTPAVARIGEPIFLLCSVSNTGSRRVQGATVKYYVCEPATVPTPGISLLVGQSFVDLDAGETKEVLCLQSWTPRVSGHFCVIAEVTASEDPSPFTANTPWQIHDRHIAQHNLNIENLSNRSALLNVRSFAVAGIANEPYSFLEARHARDDEFKAIFAPFGDLVRNNLTAKTRVGFVSENSDKDRVPEPQNNESKEELKGLRVNEQRMVDVALMLPDISFDQVYGSVTIVEQFDSKHNVLGGVAFGLVKGPPGTTLRIRNLSRPASTIPVSIPYRPYSTHVETDLMTFDGIFCSNFGKQNINMQIRNDGSGPLTGLSAYVESIADPNIVTQFSLSGPIGGGVQSGASFKARFLGDFSRAASNETLVSIIVQQQSGSSSRSVRILKKIFVVGIDFDPTRKTFRVNIPQGSLQVVIATVIAPKPIPPRKDKNSSYPLLIKEASMTWIPVPAYAGQDGPLPFEDPLWKVLLALIGVALLVAAAIVTAAAGGDFSIGTEGQFAQPVDSVSCCSGAEIEASTDSAWAAGLFAASAAFFVAAGLADGADLHIRGRENTVPANLASLTVSERADFVLDIVDVPSPGTRFTGKIQWKYERTFDDGQTLSHSAAETFESVHYAKGREIWLNTLQVTDPSVRITHPRGKPLTIEASFFDPDGGLWRGPSLYVTAVLWSDRQEKISVELRDDGSINDGIRPNTGRYRAIMEPDKFPSTQTWYVFVLAQDVNTVVEGTPPLEAAKTIGGLLVTNQFVMGLDGKPCEFNHDAIIELV